MVATIPEVGGKPAFTPGRGATLAVAAALIGAFLIVIGRTGVFAPLLPPSFFKWPEFALGIVFLARAVGEFRLVGFFKRVRTTSFACWDTFLFSPLSLAIALAALGLALQRP